MAYNLKYYAQFYNYANSQVVINIYQDGYSGSSTQLYAVKDSLKLNYKNEDDDIYCPIRYLECEFGLYSKTDGQLYNIAACAEKEYLVVISVAGTKVFSGYIVPFEYSESYEPADVNYSATFKAIDGLRYLKYQYPSTSGIWGTTTYDTGINTELLLNYIESAIHAISLNYNPYINIYCRLFDINHTVANDRNLFDQTYISKHFLYDDKKELISYYDILYKILKSFQCIIYQFKGSYYIVRLPDLRTSTIIRYQQYAYIAGSWSNVGNSTTEFSLPIQKTSYSNCLIPENGDISILPPVKNIKLNLLYRKKNILYGGEFFESQWYSTSANYCWTCTTGVMIKGNGFQKVYHYKPRGNRQNAIVTKVEYIPIINENYLNLSGSSGLPTIIHDRIYLQPNTSYTLKIKATTNYTSLFGRLKLTDGSTYKWMNVDATWVTSNVFFGWDVTPNDVIEKTIKFITPSNNGYYEFSMYTQTGYNITIYEASIFEEASYANSTYTLTGSTSGIVDTLEYDLELLDSLDKFGNLDIARNHLDGICFLSSDRTRNWNSGDTIFQVFGAEVQTHRSVARAKFTGTLLSSSFLSPATVIGNSSGYLYGSKQFIPLNLAWDVENNSYDVELIEYL